MRGNKRHSIRKDKRAFTGLEAAIVLTAFVVVAAVFSYVVLNAGFFTTQKSKEVVHTGVEQATSSAELCGDVIGHGWKYNASTDLDAKGDWVHYYYENNGSHQHDSTNLTVVEFYLELTAGQNPMDLSTIQISYLDEDTHEDWLTYNSSETPSYNVTKGNLSMSNWTYAVVNDNGDNNALLEYGEKAHIVVALPDYGVTVNKKFSIEMKPSMGAVLEIEKTAPAAIYKTVNLH
jgi:flagellin FlaB